MQYHKLIYHMCDFPPSERTVRVLVCSDVNLYHNQSKRTVGWIAKILRYIVAITVLYYIRYIVLL